MPLIKSGSKKAVSTNIREMMAAGHPQKQAVAAALDTARRYGRKYATGGAPEEGQEVQQPGEPLRITVRPRSNDFARVADTPQPPPETDAPLGQEDGSPIQAHPRLPRYASEALPDQGFSLHGRLPSFRDEKINRPFGELKPRERGVIEGVTDTVAEGMTRAGADPYNARWMSQVAVNAGMLNPVAGLTLGAAELAHLAHNKDRGFGESVLAAAGAMMPGAKNPAVVQFLLDKGYPQKVIQSMSIPEKFEAAKNLGYHPPIQQTQRAAPVQVPSAPEAEAFLKSKGLYTITNPEVAAINHGWKPGWKEADVGSQDWFNSEINSVLKGKEPTSALQDSLEQQFAQFLKENPPKKSEPLPPMAHPDDVSDAVKAIKPEKHSPEGWDRIVKQEQEAKGSELLSTENQLSKNMVDDLVDGVKPNKVAQYLFEFAKHGDLNVALAAKEMLPKAAKSDINKALWALTKQKGIVANAVDKSIVDMLYSSKAKKPIGKQNINDAEDFLKALGHNQFDESEKHLFANPVKWAKAAGWDGKPLKPAPGWSKENWVQLTADQKQNVLADPFQQIPYPWSQLEWAQFTPEQKKAVLAKPERGGTSGVTPEDIEQYLNAQERHDIGPQWEPPKPKQQPAKTGQAPTANLAQEKLQPKGDPEIPLPTYEFESHPAPFPRLEGDMTFHNIQKAKQWGLTQPGFHATKSDRIFNEFRLPEEIPYGDGTYRRPELGVHVGTNRAAHNRIGPAKPEAWDKININSWHHDNNPYRVIQTLIKADHPLDLPDLGTWRPADIAQGLRSHSRIPHDEIAAAMKNTKAAGSWEREVIQIRSLRSLLEKYGYDSIRYVNNAEDPGSISFIKWNLNEMRSPHAKFKDRMSRDLTAAIAAGLLYPYFRNGDDKEDKMKKGGRTPMAMGGFQPSKWIPRPPRLSQGPSTMGMKPASMSHVGAIRSPIPGRTDKIPMNVRGGSYVIPASVVSGMAQGNTLAGFAALDKMFGQGPYGMKLRAPGGPPRVNFGKMASMPRIPTPRMAEAGGEMGEESDEVPIITAGGEYVVSPEAVRKIGGGNIKHGHEILDQLVMQIRRQTIIDMRKEKPPKK